MCLARSRCFLSLLFLGLFCLQYPLQAQPQTERNSAQLELLVPLIGTWTGEISGKPTEFMLWENHYNNSSLVGILIWGDCVSALELSNLSTDIPLGLEIADKLGLSSKEYIFGFTDELTGTASNRLQVDDNQCYDRPFWKKTLFTQQFFVSNNDMDQLRITKFPYRSFHSDIFRKNKPSSRLARGLKKANMGSDLPNFKKALSAICDPSITYTISNPVKDSENTRTRYCTLHRVFPVSE